MWGYAEVGQRLLADPRPADERYARWIDMYASDEFEALGAWCRGLVDRLAEEAGDAGRERMRGAFLTCSRHELDFWNTAR